MKIIKQKQNIKESVIMYTTDIHEFYNKIKEFSLEGNIMKMYYSDLYGLGTAYLIEGKFSIDKGSFYVKSTNGQFGRIQINKVEKFELYRDGQDFSIKLILKNSITATIY